jgi:hypothetical protein
MPGFHSYVCQSMMTVEKEGAKFNQLRALFHRAHYH